MSLIRDYAVALAIAGPKCFWTSLLDLNIGNFPRESKSSGRKYARGLADFAPPVDLLPHPALILRGSPSLKIACCHSPAHH